MPTVNPPLITEPFQAPFAGNPGPQPVVIGRNSTVQTSTAWGGQVTNQDDNSHPENDIRLPWAVDPTFTWLDYGCFLDVMLDPGTVLHKALPQRDMPVDTLAEYDVSNYALAATTTTTGELVSGGVYADVIQRMATSTYLFVLRGFGWRAGYQIPIPGLVRVGNYAFTPTWPQQKSNLIAGNLLGGIPLWYATWELHYLVTAPPQIKGPLAAPNPAVRMRPDAQLPASVSVPQLPVDVNAVQGAQPLTNAAGRLTGFFRR